MGADLWQAVKISSGKIHIGDKFLKVPTTKVRLITKNKASLHLPYFEFSYRGAAEVAEAGARYHRLFRYRL